MAKNVQTPSQLACTAIRIERGTTRRTAVTRDIDSTDAEPGEVDLGGPTLLARPGVDPSKIRFVEQS